MDKIRSKETILGLKPQNLADLAAKSAGNKKADNIIIFDLTELSPITDYFVICSGESDLHVRAIANQIMADLQAHGEAPWHVEGYSHAHWILLDYVDVVVHVFSQKVRDYYALERLWGDAPTQTIPVEE